MKKMIALRLLAFFFTLGAAELNTARDEKGAIRRGVIHLDKSSVKVDF